MEARQKNADFAFFGGGLPYSDLCGEYDDQCGECCDQYGEWRLVWECCYRCGSVAISVGSVVISVGVW